MAGLIPFNKRDSDIFDMTASTFPNMLDDFFSDRWPQRRALMRDTFKIDVEESEDGYKVTAELPGIKKDEISLDMDDGRLTISVQKEETTEEKEKNYIHRERSFSSMSRSIYLADVTRDGILAKLDDGVLAITVPKAAKTAQRTSIEIE